MRMLERLQCHVEVVADGLATIEAWRKGNFDLILMDCQMPGMDGYEATREIRKLEQDGRHITIVALTANAMKSDEEKCRAAGMDDYLTKPIDRVKMETCVDALMGGTGSTGRVPVLNSVSAAAVAEKRMTEAASAEEGQDLEGPINAKALAALVDGDWAFARGLVQSFADTAESGLATIGTAVAAGNWLTLSEAAHVIKGASANLFASTLVVEAGRLEDAARSGNVAEIEGSAERVRIEVARAVKYFRAWTAINEP
jgi:CheY-like chemotaxis protein/HPt (histidine-containing phosphotransfer) domain-containing protein